MDGSVDAIWNMAISGSPLTMEDSPRAIAFSHGQVDVTVDLDTDLATITIVGPKDRWFGVAFGTSTMCIHMQSDECPAGGPFAIVVSEDIVTERKLDFHGPGRIIPKSVFVISNSVARRKPDSGFDLSLERCYFQPLHIRSVQSIRAHHYR